MHDKLHSKLDRLTQLRSHCKADSFISTIRQCFIRGTGRLLPRLPSAILSHEGYNLVLLLMNLGDRSQQKESIIYYIEYYHI